VVAAVIGLAALVGIPLALSVGLGGEPRVGAGGASAQPSAPTGESNAPASQVPVASGSASSISPTGASVRPPTVGFAPMTLAAVAARVIRPARVISYPGASNGSIVSGIGTTDDGNGRVEFTHVVIPATGSYVITVFYANLDGSTTSADISISNVGTVTQTFPGTSVCCARVALAPMSIDAGSHTITIGNESGPGPSIDKIVISRP
jgi:hypothetical protein